MVVTLLSSSDASATSSHFSLSILLSLIESVTWSRDFLVTRSLNIGSGKFVVSVLSTTLIVCLSCSIASNVDEVPAVFPVILPVVLPVMERSLFDSVEDDSSILFSSIVSSISSDDENLFFDLDFRIDLRGFRNFLWLQVDFRSGFEFLLKICFISVTSSDSD